MKGVLILFFIFLIIWLVISVVLSINNLSSDGFLEFGFPLTLYNDFNGKGNHDELQLGVKPLNIFITIFSLFFIAVIVSKIIRKKLNREAFT